MDKIEFLRQFISQFIQGPNVDAMIAAAADQLQKQEELSLSVTDMCYIYTALDSYLDTKAAEKNMFRPPELGMGNKEFADLVIAVNANKQVAEAIHKVLAVFYGEDAVRAWTRSQLPEPYNLSAGDELWIELEGERVDVVFDASSFQDIHAATAAEVADAITRSLQLRDLSAYALEYIDTDTDTHYVTVYGGARGPFSMVKVIGGKGLSVMEFPDFRPTTLPVNDTIYQITKGAGFTLRYRWVGGTKPLLGNVYVGDTALIYGNSFISAGLSGTFEVKAISAAGAVPATNSGWFEVENSSIVDSLFSVAIQLTSYADLKFALPRKATAYGLSRYALGFEPEKKLLRIYMPATTQVVSRGLEGAAHLHLAQDPVSFDGTFANFEVVDETAIKIRNEGRDTNGMGGTIARPPTQLWSSLDNILDGTVVNYLGKAWVALQRSGPLYGGAVTPDLTPIGRLFWVDSVAIDTAWRESGFVTIKTLVAHGIHGDTEYRSENNYLVGAIVWFTNRSWKCLVNNGPLYLGAVMPAPGAVWMDLGPALNMSSEIVGVVVAKIYEDVGDFVGPYVIDSAAPYTLTDMTTTSREKIFAGDTRRFLTVDGLLPNTPGHILVDLAKDTQEGPIPYLGSQLQTDMLPVDILSISQTTTTVNVKTKSAHGLVSGSKVLISGTTAFNGTFVVASVSSPTNFTYLAAVQVAYEVVGTTTFIPDTAISALLIDPSYSFKYAHDIGADITLTSASYAYTPDVTGIDYNFYVTGVAEGRVYAQKVLTDITALGIKLEFVIIFPNDVGLGDWSGIKTDRDWVWGV